MTNAERIQANNASLRECIEIAENLPDAGGGGGTITFRYEDRTLTADAGMTWAEFIESDYNPSVECGCCGETRRLIDSFENISGGESGDGEVVGFYEGESPGCAYGNYGGQLLVYKVTSEDASQVGLDEVIEEGQDYANLYSLT